MVGQNNNILQAAEPALNGLKPFTRDIIFVGKFFGSVGTIAVHMMFSFYLLLLLYAIFYGSAERGPELIPFVIIWHLLAIPLWLLKLLFQKFTSSPVGLLAFYTGILVIIFVFFPSIESGLTKILAWVSDAAQNFIPG